MHFLQGRHVRRLCTVAAFSTSGAGGLSGCTYTEDCGEERMCLAPPPSPCEVNEPGMGPVMDECGVFASASAPAEGARAGTRLEPLGSLQAAIVEAQGRGLRHLYACGEMFEEEVTLVSGIHLWGGRGCDDGAWSFDGANHPTIIAPPSGIPLRVVGDEGATSVIYGVRVVAADASASDGKSSIAMILSAGAGAIVRSSAIVAGDGKDGEPGKDADSERAADGVLGIDGADACTEDSPTGALPVVTACDDGAESTGGYGGDGGLDAGGDGAPGQPRPAGNQDPEKTGLGGRGADALTRCKEGDPGPDGAAAGRADGAVGMGYLTEDGWVGVRGQDGERGGVGHGGGGGGGSKGRGEQLACRAGLPEGGAAGGSGGSGGCGGRGGHGGGSGGASIGVVALQGSAVTLEATTVTAGNGGNGGVGGTGQPGGVGRWGGHGGTTFVMGMWEACRGGRGGNGGRGGDAGGGLGGPSYGVASFGAFVGIGLDAHLQPGGAGKGGSGGNAAPNDPVGEGEAGHSLPYVQFGAPDPEPPR
ncbi:hypothetical protein WMF39_33850 [Sorangium sp. So ce1504]|uniref:hypothetical protein n=1 Tax=Sorangium sp. So ce1504 TaxID=3133337 RepID=UPI003F62778F